VLLLVADVFWLIADEKEEKACPPEIMGDYSFTKLERLTKRPEFQKVLAYGEKKRIGRLCIVFSISNGLNRKRLGVIASKKVGNAVARNRVKRAIREIFRQMKHRMTPAVDIVVISGKEMVAESYKVIDEKLSNALLAIK
jgi:ribonuclease P protein component